MKCPNCGHENGEGKFCENCGKQLVEIGEKTVKQPNLEEFDKNRGASQAEDYLKKTTNQSKQYFTFFIDVLKKPYASLQASYENQHFIFAIITFVLYSLFIPLMIYFGIKGAIDSLSNLSFGTSVDVTLPFMDVVIKPFFGYGIFMVIIAAFTYLSIKLGRVNVTFKEVFTRFGTLLIPFVFILAIGLILSILKVSMFVLFMVIGLIGAMYIVVPVLIAFYKKESPGEGLDVVYGTLLTYVLTIIVVLIMGEIVFDSLITSIESYFGGY